MILVHVEHFLNEEGQKFFSQWLKKVENHLSKHRGFQSISQLKWIDDPTCCHLLLYFDSLENLRIWSSSEDHNNLIAELLPFRQKKHQSKIFIEKSILS